MSCRSSLQFQLGNQWGPNNIGGSLNASASDSPPFIDTYLKLVGPNLYLGPFLLPTLRKGQLFLYCVSALLQDFCNSRRPDVILTSVMHYPLFSITITYVFWCDCLLEFGAHICKMLPVPPYDGYFHIIKTSVSLDYLRKSEQLAFGRITAFKIKTHIDDAIDKYQ